VWRSTGQQDVDRTVGLRIAGTAGSRLARGCLAAACFIGGEGDRAFTATRHPGLNSQYGERPRPARAQENPRRTGGQCVVCTGRRGARGISGRGALGRREATLGRRAWGADAEAGAAWRDVGRPDLVSLHPCLNT
jgi:hypothetical protein